MPAPLWKIIQREEEPVGPYPVNPGRLYPTLESIEASFDLMTDRQFAILTWIAAGKTNPEIVSIFKISINTLDREISQIFTFLNVENRFASASLFLYWEINNRPNYIRSEQDELENNS